jgi:tRNA-modifying protein YgfZ
MNPNWQNFLTAQGANFGNQVVQHFGDAAAERLATRDGTVLCDLSQFGVLKVSGADAQTFLQNLLSSDVRLVTPQQAQPSSFNTAKGRMLASLWLWQTGEDYFLHLSQDLCALIHKKLSMYVLRAKVKISDVSDEVVCLGVSGEGAAAAIQTCFGSAPNGVLQVEQLPHASVICSGAARFQIHTTTEHAVTLWQQLCATATPVGSACWDWLNVRAGVPVITLATQEQLVLQMSNLDVLGGVSFKKGCYPGQEIVARMHYLGKLKQRTYLAHIEAKSQPQPNDPLYSADYAEQISGTILNAAAAPEGGYDVLATLHSSSIEAQQSVHWNTPDGAPLRFLDLPYALPTAAAK